MIPLVTAIAGCLSRGNMFSSRTTQSPKTSESLMNATEPRGRSGGRGDAGASDLVR
jgi:hypothetical protein